MTPKKKRELVSLRVSAIALVDEPANKRRWLVFKRKAAAAAQGGNVDPKKVKKVGGGAGDQGPKPVAKQAVVLDADALDGVVTNLQAGMDLLAQFAETVSGKTVDANGMVIFTEEDLGPWLEVGGVLESVNSAFSGAPVEGEEPPPPEAEVAANADDRMAKFEQKMETRFGQIEEALGLLIERVVAPVDKSDEPADPQVPLLMDGGAAAPKAAPIHEVM